MKKKPNKTWEDRELIAKLVKKVRNYPKQMNKQKFPFKPDLSKSDKKEIGKLNSSVEVHRPLKTDVR